MINEEKEPNLQLYHVPVLLQEAVELLSPAPGAGRVYVDGTLGGGGHAEEILRRTAPDGMLIGIDRDADAVSRCRGRLGIYGSRAALRQANFREMKRVVNELGFPAVDGILLDLGVSWFHVKTPERGFSFMLEGPLDMRMDTGAGSTAADLVNRLSREELERIIREFGEEKKARAVARAIERARAGGPITTTVQLAGIVSRVFPPSLHRRIHPATRTFQALRIAVNDEISALETGIEEMISILKPGGRLVVITFHSLEDRVVKQAFAASAKGCVCPPRLPVCACGRRPGLRPLTKKPMTPSKNEMAANPAARSAKLRAAEKI